MRADRPTPRRWTAPWRFCAPSSRRDVDSADLAFWYGAGLTASGRLAEARAVVDIGRVKNPEEPRIWNLDAILAVREGNSMEAQQILTRLLERNPDDPVARQNLDLLARRP